MQFFCLESHLKLLVSDKIIQSLVYWKDITFSGWEQDPLPTEHGGRPKETFMCSVPTIQRTKEFESLKFPCVREFPLLVKKLVIPVSLSGTPSPGPYQLLKASISWREDKQLLTMSLLRQQLLESPCGFLYADVKAWARSRKKETGEGE